MTKSSPSIQHQRKTSAYLRALSVIVSEIRVSSQFFPTVLSVNLSRDNHYLDVFVTFEAFPEQGLETLNRARGFVRTELARICNERITPEIRFKIDDSHERGQRIEQILKKIKEEEKK